MSSGKKVASEVFRCRKSFEIDAAKLNFFPGHMNKGMNKMQARLSRVDCFVEIHDARIPFSGRNTNFYHKLTAVRPHILVFNKMDLADRTNRAEIRDILMRNEPNLADVIWTNSNVQFSLPVKSIMATVTDAIENKAFHNVKAERNIMLIGVPNVGKSSVLNSLRRTFLRKDNLERSVGDQAGVTRAVQERVKLMDRPLTFCFDTPGVTAPRPERGPGDVETTMRLAACSCYKDDDVGLEKIADYLLYFFNKREMFWYVSHFGLEEPTDDIFTLLLSIAKNVGMVQKVRNRITNEGGYKLRYDTRNAAGYFLQQYRSGKLGHFILDEDKLEEERAKHSRLRIPGGGASKPLSIGAV